MATRTRVDEKPAAAGFSTTTEAPASQVPVLGRTRLPYHETILKERFGVDASQWQVLVDAIFPSAKTVEAILLALSYCSTNNLNVFRRPINIVPMWNSKLKREVETIWPGIAELRTTAHRTKDYAGIDAAQIGTMVEMKFDHSYVDERTGETKGLTKTVSYPEWMSYRVYRMVHGQRMLFEGPRVYWLEAYADTHGSGVPNKMWADRPIGQLDKCAEAAALRRAFPEEIGNQYAAEEMEGRTLVSGTEPLAAEGPVTIEAAAEQQTTQQTPDAKRKGPPPAPPREAATTTTAKVTAKDGYAARLIEAGSEADVVKIGEEIMADNSLSEEDRSFLRAAYKATLNRVRTPPKETTRPVDRTGAEDIEVITSPPAAPPGVTADGKRVHNVAGFYQWLKPRVAAVTSRGALDRLWEDEVLIYQLADDELLMLTSLYDYKASEWDARKS